MKHSLTILVCLFLMTCDSDDNANQCTATESIASMDINGESFTFQTSGRGINLMPNGKYLLGLNLDNRSGQAFDEQTIRIESILGETGENEIDRFYFRFIRDDIRFEGDFTMGNFQNNVISNNNNCFEATFSGNLAIDGQEFNIINGVLKFVYDEPFEDTNLD